MPGNSPFLYNGVIPYAKPDDARIVQRAIPQRAATPTWVGYSDTAYAHLFAALWEQAVPFIIIEHDVIPWPGALDSLVLCNSPWCAFAYADYDLVAETTVPFSVSRFVPSGPVPFEAFTPPSPTVQVPTWDTMDVFVTRSLRSRGQEVCQHKPGVTHLSTH